MYKYLNTKNFEIITGFKNYIRMYLFADNIFITNELVSLNSNDDTMMIREILHNLKETTKYL